MGGAVIEFSDYTDMIKMPPDDKVLERLAATAGPGLMLEFGVLAGASLRRICAATSRTVFGFDSFAGLPEDYRPGFGKGTFAGAMPHGLPSNAAIVEGDIGQSLPNFLFRNRERVAFAHFDLDVYSPTYVALACLAPRIKVGSVLLFDEILDIPGDHWPPGMQGNYNTLHEWRAFYLFTRETGYKFECVGRRHAEAFAFARVQ